MHVTFPLPLLTWKMLFNRVGFVMCCVENKGCLCCLIIVVLFPLSELNYCTVPNAPKLNEL